MNFQFQTKHNGIIDLHTHSTASDGTLTPAELVRFADEIGLQALALTDHDTVEGNFEAQVEAERTGIKFIPGVEISCDFGKGNVHILGYWVNPEDVRLRHTLNEVVDYRKNRNHKIIDRLQELGVDVDYEEVAELAGGSVVGRPHFAQILLKKGYVSSIPQAFEEYLGKAGAAYIPKKRLSVNEGITLIAEAGGLPVLAHPGQYGLKSYSAYEEMFNALVSAGIQGIEVYYPEHSKSDIMMFIELARRLDLAISGGSDFHGDNKPEVKLGQSINGDSHIGIDILYELEERHHIYVNR